jgi:hypothetical protein
MRFSFWLLPYFGSICKAVLGTFLVMPLLAQGAPEQGSLFSSVSALAALPWNGFLDGDSAWTAYPQGVFGVYFLLDAVFGRARMPRLSGFLRAVRPFLLLFLLGYLVTGWSRSIKGQKVWDTGALPVGRHPIALSVDASGFPFQFSIDDPDVSTDGSVFDPVLLLTDTVFYASLFSALWLAGMKLFRKHPFRRVGGAHNK